MGRRGVKADGATAAHHSPLLLAHPPGPRNLVERARWLPIRLSLQHRLRIIEKMSSLFPHILKEAWLMPKPNCAEGAAFDARQELWPIFWCSLLSPVLLGEIPERRRERYFQQLSQEERLLPNGQRKRLSARTLRRQWNRLRTDGLAGLYRRKRSDCGKPRRCHAELVARTVELKIKQPDKSEVKINLSLQNEFQVKIPRSTLYRHLRLAGATRSKLRTLRQDHDTKEHRWESDRKWLTKLARGNLTVEELLANANRHIMAKDARALLECIREQPSCYSDRAVGVLSHYSGIPRCHIVSFLGVSERTLRRWVRVFTKYGIQVLLRSEFPEKGPLNRVEGQEYINAVFEILHAPPSTYGINRTTWRLKDIASMMAQRGLRISGSSISKIIHNAGYNYRKAKRVLTSPDPEYKEKLKEITRILSNLGPKEKFFSVDEFGPFSVKIQGGRSLTPPGQTRNLSTVSEEQRLVDNHSRLGVVHEPDNAFLFTSQEHGGNDQAPGHPC